MPPVFAHGRLRLYLLKLLDEAPRHGYEVIRLLEERFQGLYAPSAGTVYPRLSKLEAEGLVTHTTEGGRKVYSITDAGRAELASRSAELADLEVEIRDSVAELAAEIRADVRGAAGDLRREMRAAVSANQQQEPGPENQAWQTAKEELRRATQEWKEQARRAKDESRRARADAQHARRQAQETQERAREEMQRIAHQVQEQVQAQFGRGERPGSVREGLTELTSQLSAFAKEAGAAWSIKAEPAGASGEQRARGPEAGAPNTSGWAADTPETGDAARDLDRLLDRFRDEIRDAARDHGVSSEQLTEARHGLARAAQELKALLGKSD
ncbi:helix-turn-helix transcriptional regulator [Streptomyces sp. NPDC006879]|uniref:PadR family transcriptional regulator n=1 Tax=Streptomyces sp. NPDC006879 TaxID=3364767 RepID=UPI0036BC9041